VIDEYTDQIGVRLYLLCILHYTEFGWIYVREVGRTDSRDCRTGKVPSPAVLGRLGCCCIEFKKEEIGRKALLERKERSEYMIVSQSIHQCTPPSYLVGHPSKSTPPLLPPKSKRKPLPRAEAQGSVQPYIHLTTNTEEHWKFH
jgi:hypothetical protein